MSDQVVRQQNKAERAKRKQEAKIQKVLRKMTSEEVDEIVGDKNAEFNSVADAVMAWYGLLFAANIFRQEPDQREAVKKALSASLVILGTIVKYAYALGLRRGKKSVESAVRLRRKK